MPTPDGRARGLYIHVPFCARACPYCDFDFEVGRRPATAAFFAGLQREWDARGPSGGFSTVYVGGGTPSMLGPEGLRTLLAWISARVEGPLVEWTVELNPEHVDGELLDVLVGARVDRVSLGVQTFDPGGLRMLGRVHDAATAIAAVRSAQAAGLRVSVDLIVGWPGQSADRLNADLDQVLELGVTHVSIYALTIEAGTPWTKLVRRGLRRMPQDDVQVERLVAVETRLHGAGFEHYEVASYGRGDDRGRHNLGYWQFGDYVGLGPSAASATFRGGSVDRRSNIRSLAAWSRDPGAATVEGLAGARAAAEGLWIGLRQLGGIALEGSHGFLGAFPQVDRAWVERRAEGPIASGNLEWAEKGRVLRMAPGRWLWHDEVGLAILEP